MHPPAPRASSYGPRWCPIEESASSDNLIGAQHSTSRQTHAPELAPVTMAVFPLRSTPLAASSAVEYQLNPLPLGAGESQGILMLKWLYSLRGCGGVVFYSQPKHIAASAVHTTMLEAGFPSQLANILDHRPQSPRSQQRKSLAVDPNRVTFRCDHQGIMHHCGRAASACGHTPLGILLRVERPTKLALTETSA